MNRRYSMRAMREIDAFVGESVFGSVRISLMNSVGVPPVRAGRGVVDDVRDSVRDSMNATVRDTVLVASLQRGG